MGYKLDSFGEILTRGLLLFLGLFSLTLVVGVLLRRFLKQLLFSLRDERRLHWAHTVDEALQQGGVPEHVPLLRFGGKLAAEEALLQRFRAAEPQERLVLQSLFRTWGLLEIRRARLRRWGKWERAHSALALGHMQSKEALPDLLSLLERADADTQAAVVNALELLGEPAAIEGLVKFLSRRGHRRERTVLSALIRCGQNAPEHLASYLTDKLSLVRITVAAALAEVASIREVPVLIQAASDPEAEVRAKVAAALGRIGNPRAFTTLRLLATDPVWYVRMRAIDALPKTRVPEVRDQLIQALRDTDWRVRGKAAVGLYKFAGDPVDLLREIREGSGDRYALEALVAALEREGATWQAINCICSPVPRAREESQNLIAQLLRAQKFTSALYALETHPERGVRQEVLRLIQEQAGPSVQEPLKRLLESPTLDAETRRGVEVLLSRYQQPS